MFPDLSIIVPVYKVEPYLRQCIDSILSQTFEDFELILIDDGSPDKCGEICDEYAAIDPRVKVIHQPNQGLSVARNKGIEAARGYYLAFVDSDDWLEPDMYRILIMLVDTYDADIAECAYVKVYEDGDRGKLNFTGHIRVVDSIKALQEFRQTNCWHVVVWNKIYRRHLWEQIRFPEGRVHEDDATTYKLYYGAARIVQIDLALINYRQRRDSFIGQRITLRRIADAREAYADKEKFFRAEGVRSLECLAVVEATAYLMYAYLGIDRKKDSKSKSRDIKKEFNQKFKQLLKYPELQLKDKMVFSLFCLSPSLYSLNLKCGIARRLKHSQMIRKIYEWLIYRKTKPYIRQRLKGMIKSKNLFLLMVPLHGNLGDQAIIYAQNQFAADHFPDYNVVEMLHRDTKAAVKALKGLIKNDDLIWLPGGGNMGDEYITEEQARRYIIKHFPHNKIVSFPQTIYFSSTDYGRRELSKSRKIYEKNKNLTLIAREQISYGIMQKEFPKTNVMLIPDIVFYLNLTAADRERQGILCCLRNDIEGVINFEQKLALLARLKNLYSDLKVTDTVLGREVDMENREKELNQIWDDFRAAKVVITDRLHGMIFAAVTATPCVVLSNYNHKVQSSYQWVQNLDYIRFLNEYDQETVLQQVDNLFNLDSEQLHQCDLRDEFMGRQGDGSVVCHLKGTDNRTVPLSAPLSSVMLQDVVISGGRIEYKYELAGAISKYFHQNHPLVIEYSESMEGVPQGLAAIPFLTNVLPIAWLSDAQIYVDEIDRSFFNSIGDFKKGYEQMYPGVEFRGELIAKQVIDYEGPSSDRTATFFTGGVDSTATLLNRLQEKPDLITIWGADIPFDDVQGWQQVKKSVQEYADRFALKALFIKSTFRRFINYAALDRDFERILGTGWWYGVQHGLGLIGHAAPYVGLYNLKTVYIPASFSINNCVGLKCASVPWIDDQVRFACSSVLHEGFENHRQDKIRQICQYCRDTNEQIILRVCWESRGGGNCSRCEKCARSIMGIMAEHAEPQQFGFNIDGKTLKNFRKQLQHNWEIPPINSWKGIQNRFLSKREYWNNVDEVSWILTYDFENNNRSIIKRGRRIKAYLISMIPVPLKNFIKKFLAYLA